MQVIEELLDMVRHKVAKPSAHVFTDFIGKIEIVVFRQSSQAVDCNVLVPRLKV